MHHVLTAGLIICYGREYKGNCILIFIHEGYLHLRGTYIPGTWFLVFMLIRSVVT